MAMKLQKQLEPFEKESHPLINKTHINNVFDTSTVQIDQDITQQDQQADNTINLNDGIGTDLNGSLEKNKDNTNIKSEKEEAGETNKTNKEDGKQGSGSKNKKQIGHYYIDKQIGEGTFGKVKLGTHQLTGEKVAIKILEKDRINDVADVERVAREIHILKLIRHPNIIQLYEIIETPKQLYLITEYASGGELFDYIVANTRLKEEEACKFFQQIISGVEYLHQLNIVHRDLKPENLLLDHNKNIKIVDFGLSNIFGPGELLKTACGSPCYAAPEMIAGKKYVGANVDIWSCGVIMFALICGFLPFEDPDTSKLYKKILSGEFKVPSFVNKDAQDLLKKILNTDPDKRFKIDDIRGHPWFQLNQPVCINKGLIVGYSQILNEEVLIQDSIIQILEELGFQKEYALRCLDANKHNHVTTCYYLLLKKLEKEGKIESQMYSSAQPSMLGNKQMNISKDSVAIQKLKEGQNEKESGRGIRSKSSGRAVPKGSSGVGSKRGGGVNLNKQQHRQLADSIEAKNYQAEFLQNNSRTYSTKRTDEARIAEQFEIDEATSLEDLDVGVNMNSRQYTEVNNRNNNLSQRSIQDSPIRVKDESELVNDIGRKHSQRSKNNATPTTDSNRQQQLKGGKVAPHSQRSHQKNGNANGGGGIELQIDSKSNKRMPTFAAQGGVRYSIRGANKKSIPGVINGGGGFQFSNDKNLENNESNNNLSTSGINNSNNANKNDVDEAYANRKNKTNNTYGEQNYQMMYFDDQSFIKSLLSKDKIAHQQNSSIGNNNNNNNVLINNLQTTSSQGMNNVGGGATGVNYYNSGGISSKTKIRNSLMGRVGDSDASLNSKSPQINKKFRRDYNLGTGTQNQKLIEGSNGSHYALNSSTSGLHENVKGTTSTALTLSSKKNKQQSGPRIKSFKSKKSPTNQNLYMINSSLNYSTQTVSNQNFGGMNVGSSKNANSNRVDQLLYGTAATNQSYDTQHNQFTIGEDSKRTVQQQQQQQIGQNQQQQLYSAEYYYSNPNNVPTGQQQLGQQLLPYQINSYQHLHAIPPQVYINSYINTNTLNGSLIFQNTPSSQLSYSQPNNIQFTQQNAGGIPSFIHIPQLTNTSFNQYRAGTGGGGAMTQGISNVKGQKNMIKLREVQQTMGSGLQQYQNNTHTDINSTLGDIHQFERGEALSNSYINSHELSTLKVKQAKGHSVNRIGGGAIGKVSAISTMQAHNDLTHVISNNNSNKRAQPSLIPSNLKKTQYAGILGNNYQKRKNNQNINMSNISQGNANQQQNIQQQARQVQPQQVFTTYDSRTVNGGGINRQARFERESLSQHNMYQQKTSNNFSNQLEEIVNSEYVLRGATANSAAFNQKINQRQPQIDGGGRVEGNGSNEFKLNTSAAIGGTTSNGISADNIHKKSSIDKLDLSIHSKNDYQSSLSYQNPNQTSHPQYSNKQVPNLNSYVTGGGAGTTIPHENINSSTKHQHTNNSSKARGGQQTIEEKFSQIAGVSEKLNSQVIPANLRLKKFKKEVNASVSNNNNIS